MLTLLLEQCYYSIVIHVFIDFHVNLIEMSVGETLDFICFVAIQCNGTSVIAEIHRVIMGDLDRYRQKYLCSPTMFSFLCSMFTELWPHINGIGSCTDPRYTYSAGSSSTNWSQHQDDLLALCSSFFSDSNVTRTRASLIKASASIMNEFLNAKDSNKKKKYKGVKAMGATQFIQLAATLGLVPLFCYTHAELLDDDLGPARVIRTGLGKSKKEYPISMSNSFFGEVVSDLQTIWGPAMTPALIENTLCELSRCYKKTVTKQKKAKNEANPPLDIILNREIMVDGDKNDVCYFDHRRNCVQKFFMISAADGLRPDLVMKKASQWGEINNKANLSITNWTGNKDDNGHLKWSDNGANRTLDSLLILSDELEKEYVLDE